MLNTTLPMQHNDKILSRALLGLVVFSVLLVVVSLYNFLLFHVLVELFAIGVATLMFVIMWQTYQFSRNNFLMFLGSGYFWIAGLDLIHTLVYKGMDIYPITTASPATEFWITARFLEAILLLTAPLFLIRSLNIRTVFSTFGTFAILAYFLIMTDKFPDAFIEGEGLTPFKIYSEYFIIIILAGAIIHLTYMHRHMNAFVRRVLTISIVLTILAELSFTFYVSVYGLSIIVGHIFKFSSYWLISIAIVRSALHEPYYELEQQIDRRTNELIAEIADRRKNEEKINQRQEAIKSIGNKANETLQLEVVLSRILQGTLDITGATVGMIFLMNQQSRTLRWGASIGLSKAFRKSYKRKKINVGEGLTGTIAETGKPIFIPDNSSNDPRIVRSVIEAEGLNSFIGVPIMAGNEIVAVMNILTRPPEVLAKEEIGTISAIGTHVGSSIHNASLYKELETVKKESEKANQAKSQFLASMSHDLRTPLNAIMGFSDMMRTESFGPLGDTHYEEYANDIHNSGSLLISLINDVLDLSKIEAGKYELVEKKLHIVSLIEASFLQLRNIADTSAQTLCSDIPASMPTLWGDERAMIQILNNLVSNAIKFTPEGGKICVEAWVHENNGIIITVTDTGEGMSEEGITKALKPFEQADGIHTRKHEGTGLGLHLCLNFMTLFGGTLKIESALGKGTAITLRFPPERTILPDR